MSAVPQAAAARGAAARPASHTALGAWQLAWREAGSEFAFGLRSGVIALIFIGLTAYLLMVLSHAGYLRQMGAADIPRNAPSLVYMMTSGDAFFLLFAWAWVFAQPVMRDRQAQLQELVMAAPVSLRALLLGRFLGAAAVAMLLGSSQVLGFLMAPVLEWLGIVPAGSVGPTPWAALAWAWLVFVVPGSLGCGALYLIAGLRTRSLAGPFAAAAALMMCWMFAMIVLKDAHMDPFWSTLLDPTGFAEAESQALNWTPHEKSTALLALTPALVLNRLLWCGLPLLWLGWTVLRARREQLVLERPARQRRVAARVASAAAPVAVPAAAVPTRWLLAAWAESCWQCRQALARKGLWLAAGGLVLIGVAGAYAHVVGHADGPLVPRAELLAPLMLKMMYLLVAFVVAGAAGLIVRRDGVEGFGEMLDAAPAPDGVRLAGRAAAVFAMTAVFALVPGVSGVLVVLLSAPGGVDPLLPLTYQLAVMLPALLEMAAMMVLMHALIRPAGLAYASSMLVAFIFIVNHELELVAYPPAEVAIPAHVLMSGLTGWAPWTERLLAGDAWKLACALLMLALAGLAAPRGTDGRWRVALRQARARLMGPVGLAGLAAVLALAVLGPWQHLRLVEQGGYRSLDGELADAAAWERRWLAQAAPFSATGGDLAIDLSPADATVRGEWRLHGVVALHGVLQLELPRGLHGLQASVGGKPVPLREDGEHAELSLPACAAPGCELLLRWQVAARGWDAKGAPPWMLAGGVWARAADLAPRLGLDRERIVRAPNDRIALDLPAQWPALPPAAAVAATGIAPAPASAGAWRWTVRRQDGASTATQRGVAAGALDFAAWWTPQAQSSQVAGLVLFHDAGRAATAQAVGADVADMRRCVARRLGQAPAVREVLQMPRGMGNTALVDGRLLLPEGPGWDVAQAGTGRALRRADIAAAMARQHFIAQTGLRGADGALWLTQGMGGAIGLLCAGDAGGVSALSALLLRGADAATQSLAASAIPVGAAPEAVANGWLKDYAPLALLAWAAARTPQEIDALLAQVKSGGSVPDAVRHVDAAQAEALLGAPRAVDLRLRGARIAAVQAWRWRDGGWREETPAQTRAHPVRVTWRDGVLAFDAPGEVLSDGGAPWLMLDAVPGFERAPKDNLHQP
ncbi:hypothetical protein [Janthinobacterium rivuli]|uniref:hypothetical protein n=1 Tax=Janthinobacterium rivuli TaxID=2751478 RepID=UPI00383B6A27